MAFKQPMPAKGKAPGKPGGFKSPRQPGNVVPAFKNGGMVKGKKGC